MSEFLELTDGEGNKFIVPRKSIGLVFTDEEGRLIMTFEGQGTEIQESYEYVKSLLIPKEEIDGEQLS